MKKVKLSKTTANPKAATENNPAPLSANPFLTKQKAIPAKQETPRAKLAPKATDKSSKTPSSNTQPPTLEKAIPVESTKIPTRPMTDLDPSLVGHVTLNVPIPPGTEERLRERIERIQRGVEAPMVGDTKKALDDMRDKLLNFYSSIYTMSGGNIDSRLSALKERSTGGDRIHAPPVTRNFANELSPTESAISRSEYATYVKDKNQAPGGNDLGVLHVLSELTNQVKNLEQRIDDNCGNVMSLTEDPHLRSFFANAQHGRNHPDFSGSCKNLYGYLKSRSKANDDRIRALQSRLKLMQLQLNDDKKHFNGLGVDTRRAS